jgi:hypothetical protein
MGRGSFEVKQRPIYSSLEPISFLVQVLVAVLVVLVVQVLALGQALVQALAKRRPKLWVLGEQVLRRLWERLLGEQVPLKPSALLEEQVTAKLLVLLGELQPLLESGSKPFQ